ncbi:MAG: hypothetical protein FWD53_11720, partial [Phycisphaerales bacterium]|nr:hypothetical protein [Phycisphaerales bacterium]
MKFSRQARLVGLLFSAAIAVPMFAEPDSQRYDSMQYDGLDRWEFHDRANKGQGLDTLVSRGRVRPYDLLVTKEVPEGFPVGREGAIGSTRTIFRDLYTGAEIWKLTNHTNGIIQHAGNDPWNANGRLIRIGDGGGSSFLIDQETLVTTTPATVVRRWSPTEPYVTFISGTFDGVRAIWVFDVMQQKPLRAIAPVGQRWGNISGISPDGQWLCWLEGTQDLARRFGIAK